MGDESEVTRLLRRLPGAREEVEDQLLELMEGRLRGIATRLMRGERPDHSLQPTLIVDEAWMELAGQERSAWSSRGHFLAVAARCMRRLLVNHARDRRAAKRGGENEREALVSVLAIYEERNLDVLALHEALERLAHEDELAARVVELRFFGGLSMPEAAEALETPLRTVERAWLRARLQLKDWLGGHD